MAFSVSDCTFTDNWSGIYLYGYTGEITGCAFEDNTYYAIYLDDSPSAAIQGNIILRNRTGIYLLGNTSPLVKQNAIIADPKI